MPILRAAFTCVVFCFIAYPHILQGQDQKPVETAKVEERKDGLYYLIGQEKPFTGSTIKYHKNGFRKETETYKDGKWHGIHRGWHENKKIKHESEWRRGLEHGLQTEWDLNGNKLSVFSFSFGELDVKKSVQLTLALALLNQKSLGPSHPVVAINYKFVGAGHNEIGEYDKALSYYDKALAIHLKAKKPNYPEIYSVYNFIANAQLAKGKHDEAIKFFRKSLAVVLEHKGKKHPDTVSAYTAIGNVLANKGDHDKAVELLLKAVAIELELKGAKHPDIAERYGNIADTYMRKGDFDKLLEFQNKKLAIKLVNKGPNHPDVAECYQWLGFGHVRKNEPVKAQQFLQKSLGIYIKAKTHHKELILVLDLLISQQKRHLGETNLSITQYLNLLAKSHISLGEFDKAERAYLEFFSILQANRNNKDLSKYVREVDLFIANVGLSKIYEKKGDFPNAIKFLVKTLTYVEKTTGAESQYMVGSLEILVGYLVEAEKHDEALVQAERLKSLVLKIHGEKSSRGARMLGYFHEVYSIKGNHKQALKYITRAVEIKNELKEEDKDLSTFYNKLGDRHRALKQFKLAKESYQKSQKITLLIHGSDSVQSTYSAVRLALLLIDQGKFDEAEAPLVEALAIRQSYLGLNHPTTALSYGNLAKLYQNLGRLDEAEQYAQLELDAFVKAWGNHVKITPALGQLAAIQQDKGNYNDAALNQISALRLTIRAYGKLDIQTSAALNNLALLELDFGNPSAADFLISESIKIKRNIKTGAPFDLAVSLANRAVIKGQIASQTGLADLERDTLKDLKEAYNIHKKTQTLGTPEGAALLNSLGSWHLDNKDINNGLHFLKEALAVQLKNAKAIERIQDPILFGNLASAYHALKQYEKESYYLELNGKCTLTPPQKRMWGQARASLAMVKQDYRTAFSIYSESFNDYKQIYTPVLIKSSDHGAARIKEKAVPLYNEIHSAVFVAPKYSEGVILGVEFNAIYKNRIEALRQLQVKQKLATNADRRTLERNLDQKLAVLKKAETPKPRVPISWQIDMINEARLETLAANKELSDYDNSKFKRLSSLLVGEQFNITGITASIPKNACFLDFVAYNRLDFSMIGRDASRGWRYGVYIVYPSEEREGSSPRIEAVDLGEADKINLLVDKLNESGRGFIPDRKLHPLLEDLSKLVYLPLAKKIKRIDHLIISPANKLNAIPFEYLKSDEKYLIEKHAISYVGSGRDLVRLNKSNHAPKRTEPKGGPSIVIGNPNYDLNLNAEKSAPPKPVRAGKDLNLLSSSNSDRLNSQADSLRVGDDVRAGFKPLPNTESEAKTIYPLIQGEKNLLLGDKARESYLWRASNPRTLHIATHSYFEKQTEQKKPKAQNWKDDLFGSSKPSEILEKIGSNRLTLMKSPLSSCGLALAGANHQGSSDKDYKEDGILTGMEIALLNLSGTRLVVISSCKSSAGSVFFGEGSQSLSRAFRIAGAKTVVASHWPVSDKATSQLMSDFHKGIRSGKTHLEAFRLAQLNMMKSKVYNNPYFWASFSLTGDWR